MRNVLVTSALVGLAANSFGQFAPTTFSYSVSSTHFPFQSRDQTTGQTGQVMGTYQSGPELAGVASASVGKHNGGHFRGSLGSYTELTPTSMGPATIRSTANAQKRQEFQITGTGAIMGFEGGVNPSQKFTGQGRVRTAGSLGFLVYRRSGSSWNLFGQRNQIIDISNGSFISNSSNLTNLSLTPGDYRIETTFSAYSESRWTGTGTADGIVSYDFAYFLEELDGQVFSNTQMLLTNPVPEPITGLVLLTGAAGLVRRRKRGQQ